MEAIDTDWQTPTGLPFQPRLDRGVDGDAADLGIDLGSRTRTTVRMRMKGIDTAEVYGVDEDFEAYRRGTQYSDFARTWFEETAGDEGWPFLPGTEKDHGTYGWWPGRIVTKQTGKVYNEAIVDAFPAVAS